MEERERMLDAIMEMQKWNGIKDEQIEALEKENQALKERWEKLKKLLEEDMKHNSKEYDESFCTAFQHYSATENWVLDRMQELEEEE